MNERNPQRINPTEFPSLAHVNGPKGTGNIMVHNLDVYSIFGDNIQIVYETHGAPFFALKGFIADYCGVAAIEHLNIHAILFGVSFDWVDYAARCHRSPRFANDACKLVYDALDENGLSTSYFRDYLFRYAGLLIGGPPMDWLLICDTGVCGLNSISGEPVLLNWGAFQEITHENDAITFSCRHGNVAIHFHEYQFWSCNRHTSIANRIAETSALCGFPCNGKTA